MANFNSVPFSNLATPLTARVKANQNGGRIRFLESFYIAPASGASPAIGDKIIWGKLPVKARVLGHLSRMYWNNGGAGCTLNVGDSIVPARHLVATSVAVASAINLEQAAQLQTATADVTIGSFTVTNLKSLGAFVVGANIGGTGILAGTIITGISGFGASAVVTMSQAATVTNAAVTLTIFQGCYETQDDSGTFANLFASATDDCVIQSVVAGAQIANNQCFTLKMAYTQD